MKPNKHEIVGQYATDHILHAGHPGLNDDSLGVKTRGSGRVAFHHPQTLFDENEGVVSEITGQRRVVSPEDEFLELEGVNIHPDQVVLGSTRERRSKRAGTDLADEWMRQNGHKW